MFGRRGDAAADAAFADAVSDACAFSKRSELYCVLFKDCLLTVCFSFFCVS